jgi:type IV pilus assembly protein PilC
LPAFKEAFDSFGAELPGATTWALKVTSWLILPLLFLTFLLVATAVLTGFGKRATRMHRLGMELTQQLLAIIGYRQFRAQLVWGRITQIAAASSQYALDPARMMRAAAANTLDMVEAGLLRHAAEGLASKDLPEALLAMPRLPHFIREMVVIGNRTKRLDEALVLAGTMAREQAMNKIGVVRQRFEVTAAIIIGLFVGFMVIAMYLPIFKMGQAVG